jgi:hypothetical protein
MCYDEPLAVRFVTSTCHLCFLFETNPPPPQAGYSEFSPKKDEGGGGGGSLDFSFSCTSFIRSNIKNCGHEDECFSKTK